MDGMSPRMHQVLEEEKFVRFLRKQMPDKFREMCFMHLSFILNLSGDKFERILADDDKSSSRRKLNLVNPIFKKKEKNSGSLFGAPLTYDSICLMTPFLKMLSSKDNLCKEGLFRKPGNRQRMRTLREALTDTGPGFSIDPNVYNAHDVCGILKEFLRELPEPLLTEKHMEAHMQIAVLGSHAQTPEEHSRYNHKKISALQLLMQLLPGATNRMILDILTLLHDISEVPETRMTPGTLATIFAPIFFFNKKVSPLDMCEVIKVVEPALAFMIVNVRKMFKVPRELAVDIKGYCKSIDMEESETSADTTKVSQTYKIRKSVSGRTLNTAVCYIDREQVKAQDSASTTQTELESLFAHIHSLPDTPNNRRYKEMVSKANCTPVNTSKKHRRSKSISASIRKRLPSISKAKSKSLETDESATPYRDILRCGVVHHRVISDSKVMVISCGAAQEKQKCLKPECHEKKDSPGNAAMLEMLQNSRLRLSSTTRTIAESMFMFSATPSSSSSGRSPFQRRKRHSSDDVNTYDECTPPKQECSNLSVDKSSLRNSTSSNLTHNKRANNNLRLPLSARLIDSPNSTCLSHGSIDSDLHKIHTQEELRVASHLVMSGSENEISYLPSQPVNKKSVPSEADHANSPLQSVNSRRPLRPCNAPGTPVMPRTLLHLARTFTMETSI